MALNRKIAYIDLSTGKIDIKPIPIDVRKKFLGGRGLDAYLLYNHTKQGCDPLGPDNTLMVSGGILTATLASATARTHVMAKSPLGGMIGSCNMGGFFAPEMAWAGFHHLVIKGKADKPVYLWIHNGKIEIRDAKNLWGKTTTETQWAIREELGDDDIKSMVIGPAGENKVRIANVMTGIKNAGGRTGMGAVMGSKNLRPSLPGAPSISRLPIQRKRLNITSASLIRSQAQRSTRPREPSEPPLSGGPPTPGEASGAGIFSIIRNSIAMRLSRKPSMKSVRKRWDPTIWPVALDARSTAGPSIRFPPDPMLGFMMRALSTPPRAPSAVNPTAGASRPC